MMHIVEYILGGLLILLAILAINTKKMIQGVLYLSILSMLAVFSFVLMRAPDVAITEAVIGSGLVTALFLFTLFSSRKEKEEVTEGKQVKE